MKIEERKTALVFGGARSIGAAAAERLANDGYDVAFTYVSRPDSAQALVTEIEKSGRRAVAIKADSADVTEPVSGLAWLCHAIVMGIGMWIEYGLNQLFCDPVVGRQLRAR